MENNKLIAEFMGMKYSDERSFDNGEWTHSIKSLSKFQTSWDWLMPVIIKMADAREDTHYKLYKTIDEAYEEVVEFIKTYNDGRV